MLVEAGDSETVLVCMVAQQRAALCLISCWAGPALRLTTLREFFLCVCGVLCAVYDLAGGESSETVLVFMTSQQRASSVLRSCLY